LYGGRWNRKGVPVIYSSGSVSLAAMEVLVHLAPADLPEDLRLVTLKIPDNIDTMEAQESELPKEWRSYPSPVTVVWIGTEWLQRKESLLLRVPSAVIPQESNFLINPLHQEFSRIEIINNVPFGFDKRLFK
jgi:RES domain-containing protein